MSTGDSDWAGIDGFDLYGYDASFGETAIKPVYQLYPNGNHQFVLFLALSLIDKDGRPLTQDYLPSIDKVRSAITFLDFYNGTVLDERVAIENKSNTYDRHYPSGKKADDPINKVVVEATGPYRGMAVAYVSYYFTVKEPLPDPELHVGFKVVDDGISYFNTVETHGIAIDFEFLPPVPQNSTSFSVTGQHVPHDGENDDVSSGAGGVADANLWRRFDYQITRDALSTDTQGTAPALWTLAPENQEEYLKEFSIGERSAGGFFFKLYAWPHNVLGSDGNPLVPADRSSFKVRSHTGLVQELTVTARPGILALTLYCCAGASAAVRNRQVPIKLSVGDVYGNSAGVLVVDPSVIPNVYDRAGFEKLNFVGSPLQPTTPVDKPGGGLFRLRSMAKPGHGPYVKNLGTYFEPEWIAAYGALDEVKDPTETYHWFHLLSPQQCQVRLSRDFATGWDVNDTTVDVSSGETPWIFEPIWTRGSFRISSAGGRLSAPTDFVDTDSLTIDGGGGENDSTEWLLDTVDSATVKGSRGKWAGVDNFKFTIMGGNQAVGSATLYANGRHSVEGRITFTMTDGVATGQAVKGDDCASLDYIVKCLTFLNYDDDTAIGHGPNSTWEISFLKNDFVTGGLQRSAGAAGGPGSSEPGTVNKDTGNVVINFYVRCKKVQAINLNLGLRIQIDDDTVETPVSYTACLLDPALITDDMETLPGNPLAFKAMPPIQLTESMVSISGEFIKNPEDPAPTRGSAHSNGASVIQGSDIADIGPSYRTDLWRHWLYSIKLQMPTADNAIQLWRAVVKTPEKDAWSFFQDSTDQDEWQLIDGLLGMRLSSLYHYAFLVWPTNLFRDDGSAVSTKAKTFRLGTYVADRADFETPEDPILNISLYCKVGKVGSSTDELNTYVGATFVLYDQYGNAGQFHIPESRLPDAYHNPKANGPDFENLLFFKGGANHASSYDKGEPEALNCQVLTGVSDHKDEPFGLDATSFSTDAYQGSLNSDVGAASLYTIQVHPDWNALIKATPDQLPSRFLNQIILNIETPEQDWKLFLSAETFETDWDAGDDDTDPKIIQPAGLKYISTFYSNDSSYYNFYPQWETGTFILWPIDTEGKYYVTYDDAATYEHNASDSLKAWYQLHRSVILAGTATPWEFVPVK